MIKKDNAMPATRCVGHKFKNDIIFIFLLLAVVICVGSMFYLLRDEGDTVVLTVDGDEYATYSLNDDIEIDIVTGDEGKHINRLIIRDRKAFVEYADCPDGICVSHKPIFREGESIVCLPHRVVITIRKANDNSGPDVVQ